MSEHKGGKKNRKHGGTKRKPAQQRYVAEGRCERNKKRRIAKDAAFKAACAKVRAKAGEVVKDVCRRIRKGAGA